MSAFSQIQMPGSERGAWICPLSKASGHKWLAGGMKAPNTKGIGELAGGRIANPFKSCQIFDTQPVNRKKKLLAISYLLGLKVTLF